tara:strand:+ start:271 stop:468 length:198 start_codon:yes stop_codon:yes gene_type:complete
MKLNKEDLSYNKRMIGRRVLVLDSLKEWKGVVLNVVDEETFEVENVKTKELENVDMFRIRTLEDE